MNKAIILVALVLLLGVRAYADEIEVPEEELARESVLPVFNKRHAVLHRSVLTSERFEIGGGAGLELNEPYYSTIMYDGQATYNFSESHAFNVQGLFWTPGLSSYGTQLKAGGTGTNPFPQFDATKAPHPSWAVIGNYEYIAYYGKISVTKQTVMNLNLFGIAGLGYINMGAIGVPALNLGLGQNFFFTNNIGLRFDLRWLIFQGPNAASQTLRPQDSPAPSSFGTRIYYNAQLGLGLVFIL